MLIISADLRKIFGLGSKAVIMFLTGTLGIIIGGPVAILIIDQVNPDLVSGDVWRGLTTVAGSWIGGGANQAAMKEVFDVDDQLFSAMITVDVICANIWMAVLLIMAGRQKKIDAWLKADTSSIEELKETVSKYQEENARPNNNDRSNENRRDCLWFNRSCALLQRHHCTMDFYQRT